MYVHTNFTYVCGKQCPIIVKFEMKANFLTLNSIHTNRAGDIIPKRHFRDLVANNINCPIKSLPFITIFHNN